MGSAPAISARQLFAQEARQPERDLDLARAALLIAKEQYPGLAVEQYLARLDQLAEDVKDRLADETAPLVVLEELTKSLFGRHGFRGNKESYYDPRNSFLNDVLDRRLGIPLTLGIVMLEVGWRLRLPLEGVSFPHHFLVRFHGDAMDLLIDPFEGGRARYEDQAQELLDRDFGGRVRLEDSFLRRATKRDVLARMLNNLKGVYLNAGDHTRALSVVERMLILRPEGAEEHHARGVLLARLGRRDEAIDQLRRWITTAPAGNETDRVRGLILRLERGAEPEEGGDMSGYQAALASAAVAARPDRGRLRVTGKDPFGMLQGILTNSVPSAPRVSDSGGTVGSAPYAAVLTPKGRMVSDLRVVRGPRADEEGLLLDVPSAARPGLLAHFRMYVPPRLAKVADVTDAIGSLTVAGPGAAALLSREAFGLRVEAEELDALAEGGWRWLDTGGAGTLAIRSGDVAAPAWDVVTDTATAAALRTRLLETGAAALSLDELDVLRVEAGRPAWGADLDDGTIPPEAGIDGRAIDHGKGCYTGQEVIVRIRDRGHVNRRLRGLRLSGASLPARGTELWTDGRDQPVGAITSAVESPRAGGGLALAYVRREVAAPGEVRLGAPDGARIAVMELGPDWWRS